ncbi:RNA chaperone Hfq [Cupriavidus oxalaticus]|uniref:RNA chaperone Hfq n=1 Tax=Cupriavidus oxalaticus TaxID=96344 RepID=UPI003170A7AD
MKKKEIRPKRSSRKTLQYQHLAAQSANRAPVVIHLSNGTRLQGFVLGTDNYMVLLGRRLDDPQPTIVYKQAICLVTPLDTSAVGIDPAIAVGIDPAIAAEFVPIYIPRTRKRR